MPKDLNQDLIQTILTRGVEELIDQESLEKKLRSGKKLRIKLGIDPTSPNIHLGRSIPLLKLKDFQDAGHQIVLIIGDFTGLIGDTSDKDSERPMLDEKTVKNNLKTYINQAGKIIDIKKTEIHYNSKWLSKLNYKDIGKQADIFSLNEFISRENISRRLDEGKRVSLRELLYPLMQGYDSVAVKADVELGGTDQRFNLLTGRDIQRLYDQEAQDVVTGPLIEGLDGRKMSSSYGNTVNLLDKPDDMFGKIMSLKDDFIIRYFTLLTRVDLKVINKYESDLKSGTNPRDIKLELAQAIVTMYHGDKSAMMAKTDWLDTFSEKKIPENIQEIKVKSGELLIDVLASNKIVESKSQARRLLEEGAIKEMESDVKITDSKTKIEKSLTLKIGKKIFVRINL